MKLFILFYVVMMIVFFIIAACVVKTTPDKVAFNFAVCVFIAMVWPFFLLAVLLAVVINIVQALTKKDGDQNGKSSR